MVEVDLATEAVEIVAVVDVVADEAQEEVVLSLMRRNGNQLPSSAVS